MKILVIILGLLAVPVLALDQQSVVDLVNVAATAQGKDYIKSRMAIVNHGTNALPFLAVAIANTNMSWQQHLAARICYERIVRSDDIQALRQHDWKQYPPYKPAPPDTTKYHIVVFTNQLGRVVKLGEPVNKRKLRVREGLSMLGPHFDMGKYVIAKCKEVGLWYYYTELFWKKTAEGPLKSFDPKFDKAWPWWCKSALWGEPEEYFNFRSIIQALDNKEDKSLCDLLRDARISIVPPVLLERFDAFRARTPNTRHGDTEDVLRLIFALADARYADPLAHFVRTHPIYSPLSDKLPEVRARLTPVVLKEPPFRLGTKLVIVK